MFKKILFASDISDVSNKIVDCLGELRKLGAEEVVLIHALGIRHLNAMKYTLAQEAEPLLIVQKNILEKQGYRVKIEICEDDVSFEVKRISDKEDVSLIVIGTHGKSIAAHALLGGSATEIMHTATKPLLVIRAGVSELERKKNVTATCLDLSKSVLFATDFSDIAHRAFTYVERIIQSGCRRAGIIHVQDQMRIEKHLKSRLEEFNQIDGERLEMLKNKLIEKGAQEIKTMIPYGMPIRELLKIINSGDYSLIVMGSQGRGFIKEIFLGSVSHNIVRHASIPVLLVPAIR